MTKEARSVAEKFIAYGREKMLSETKQQLSLDDLFNQIQAGSVKKRIEYHCKSRRSRDPVEARS